MKDIFPDITCFFIGVDKDYAITILDGCGLFPTIGSGVLTCRGLMAVNKDNKLRMHDLLRDTGIEIVRKESLSWKIQQIMVLSRCAWCTGKTHIKCQPKAPSLIH